EERFNRPINILCRVSLFLSMALRSEERRVGKECTFRWSASHQKKKHGKMRRCGREIQYAAICSDCPEHGGREPGTASGCERCSWTRGATPAGMLGRRPDVPSRKAGGGDSRRLSLRRNFFFQAEDGIRCRSRHSC